MPQTYASQLTTLINAAAQTLIEKGGLPRDGELDVKLAALTTAPWPERAKEIAAAGGTGQITLGVRWGADDERAPGWEMELVLPGSGDAAGRAYEAVKFVEPPEEKGIYAQVGDPELEAARDRARAKLKAMAAHFAGGVPEGEQLNVKGPFTTTDGEVEWMWMEVTAWRGETLFGILLNDPFGTMNVHAGDRVEVKAGDAFDYDHFGGAGGEVGGCGRCCRPVRGGQGRRGASRRGREGVATHERGGDPTEVGLQPAVASPRFRPQTEVDLQVPVARPRLRAAPDLRRGRGGD